MVTPSGMVLDGALDDLDPPPVASPGEDSDDDGVVDEIDPALVDYLEFYLLNYFKPGRYEPYPSASRQGRRLFEEIGCAVVPHAESRSRERSRVADVETEYDPEQGGFNGLFATARTRLRTVEDDPALPPLQRPAKQRFAGARHLHRLQAPRPRPELLGAQLRRHAAPRVHDRAAVGRGDDGALRSRRPQHQPARGDPPARRRGAGGPGCLRRAVGCEASASCSSSWPSLVLFPPPDTASNLDPADPAAPDFPQSGHGSIALGELFLDRNDRE